MGRGLTHDRSYHRGAAPIVAPRAKLFAGRRVFATETIDATLRVDQALLSRIKRVASAADVDRDVALRRSRLKRVTARAGDGHYLVLGMYIGLHGVVPGARVGRG